MIELTSRYGIDTSVIQASGNPKIEKLANPKIRAALYLTKGLTPEATLSTSSPRGRG
jgi:hypothetical protein